MLFLAVLSAWCLTGAAEAPTITSRTPGVNHEAPGTPAASLELWLFTTDPDGALARGARMGAEEMERTASLLGRRFVLREVKVSTAAAAEEAIAPLREARGGALFALLDMDEAPACDIAGALDSLGRAVILNARVVNARCTVPWLLLRVPSRERARLIAAYDRGGGLLVDEWHASLRRFGASELNERYKRRTQQPMDGDAWTGWFAVKVAAESALRLTRPDRAALVGARAPSFDGHKGSPLRFDSSGVLQQPMYLIDPSGTEGRVIKEIP